MSDSCPEDLPAVTILPADQFDEIVATLDEPDEASALAKAAAAPRRFIRAAEPLSP